MNPPRGPSIGGPIPGAYGGPGGMRGPPPGKQFNQHWFLIAQVFETRKSDRISIFFGKYINSILNVIFFEM